MKIKIFIKDLLHFFHHLYIFFCRILDYGVRSQLVVDRRNLESLKVIITDMTLYTKALNRNLYHFRCWAGSAGFDDRYCQQFIELC